MKAHATIDDFKLLLEGVPTKFQSINVHFNPTGGSINISLVHNDRVHKILAKTLVHVLFREVGEKEFRVLFEGEVQSRNISKGLERLSVSISGLDISNNMDTMYRFFLKAKNPATQNSRVIAFFGANITGKMDRVRMPRDKNAADKADKITQSFSMIKIDEMIKKIIKEMMTTNSYTERLEEEYRFSDRFYAEADNYLEKAFDSDNYKAMFERMPKADFQTLRGIIESALRPLFYRQCTTSPTVVGDKIRNVVHFPDNPMFPAPMCNVLLPNKVTSWNSGDNIGSRPTRAMAFSELSKGQTGTNNKMTQRAYYAPGEELIEFKDVHKLSGEVTEEEEYRGMVPVQVSISHVTKMMGMSKSGDREDRDDIVAGLQNVLEYKYGLMRLAQSSGSCSGMPFSPYVLQGFPGVVMVDPFIIRGSIETVDHSINVGGISTSVTMSNCITSSASDESEDGDYAVDGKLNWDSGLMGKELRQALRDADEYDMPFPTFANRTFMPSESSETMGRIFGVKSTSSVSKDPNHELMIRQCREILREFKRYDEVGHSHTYARELTHRNIATEDEFFGDFLDLIRNNDGVYAVDKYFNRTRQLAVLEYIGSTNVSPEA